MSEQNRDHLTNECKRIEEDSMYTADTHHIIAHRESTKASILKYLSAFTAALSGVVILLGAPAWTAWLAIVSGLVTAAITISDPANKSREHIIAARNFTVLKHEARALHETFSNYIDGNEYFQRVNILREKYNKTVELTPPTDNKAFEKASERIQAGIHIPDFRLESISEKKS